MLWPQPVFALLQSDLMPTQGHPEVATMLSNPSQARERPWQKKRIQLIGVELRHLANVGQHRLQGVHLRQGERLLHPHPAHLRHCRRQLLAPAARQLLLILAVEPNEQPHQRMEFVEPIPEAFQQLRSPQRHLLIPKGAAFFLRLIRQPAGFHQLPGDRRRCHHPQQYPQALGLL